MLMMRIAQVPQTALDELMIDEVQMTAGDAQKLPTAELAKRYALYKLAKGAPLTFWTYAEEKRKDVEEKYVKKFEQKIKERAKGFTENRLTELLNMDDELLNKAAKTELTERVKGYNDGTLRSLVNSSNENLSGIAKTELKDRLSKMDETSLEKMFDINDMAMKSLIGESIAHYYGAEEDYQGKAPNKDASERTKASREAYQKMRTAEDVIEDSKLYAEKAIAKEKHNEARADSIDKFIKDLAIIRNGNKNKKENVEKGLGHGGNDDDIIRRLRKRRKEMLLQLRIK
jgi:hypothetical protein